MDLTYWMEWLLGVVGFLVFLIPFVSSGFKPLIALISVLLVAVFTSWLAVSVIQHQSVEIIISGGKIFGRVPLRMDALSAWFILIINFTVLNGAWYGIGYTRTYKVNSSQLSMHWILYVLFHLSMVSVCLVQHTFVFLIVWELMSVSSLLLILFDYANPRTLQAGLNYLIQMHIGVALLTVAFIISFCLSGSFDFSFFLKTFAQGNGKWLFMILFIGFGIKAGFIPLHSWLPHAHPAAPSHISGVMSGVIVKMGIYGIFRMLTYLRSDQILIGEIILTISVFTSLYGIFNAVIQGDFKKMLAYCTIENIGIVGMGMGIGVIGSGMGNRAMEFIGFAGAILHILNHALYKSLLFFSAGNVYLQTHTRNMEQLGGLIKKMPLTAFFFLCGSLAICGLPPLNGFASEFLIYTGLIEGIHLDNIQFSLLMIVCISFLALVGGMALLNFSRTFGNIFLGNSRSRETVHAKEISKIYLIPFALILLVMIGIGIFPGLWLGPVTRVVEVISPGIPVYNFIPVYTTLSDIGLASLLFFVLAFLIYFLKSRTEIRQEVKIAPTWGCAYTAPLSRMQYTSRSFSRSLVKLFSFLTAEKKKYKEISKVEVIPAKRNFQSFYADFLEERLIQPVLRFLLRTAEFFRFIHNGRIQFYILYGVFFILLVLIATFFNLF